MQAVVSMRQCPRLLIDGKRLQNQTTSFRQRATLHLHIGHFRYHLSSESLETSLTLNANETIFDSIMPKFKQKSENAHFFIVVALLPGKNELHFAQCTRVSNT